MPPRASIVIPAKNAGPKFRQVLEAVLAQQAPWPFEVLVVDSGSRDGTLELCARYPAVRLHRIAPEAFGHGRTRNLGASLTEGEFVVFITHDALPADEHWLRKLVEAAASGPEVAGAFGRHLPYPGADPLTQRDLNRHFDNFLNWPAVMRIEDRDRYARDEGYRQLLHFFSDNNACVRRSVWERIPYPDVEFAEDQLWAKAVLEAGYAKAYADDARVFHSHDYGLAQQFRRAFDESEALHRLFGYRLTPTLGALLRQVVGHTRADYAYLGPLLRAQHRWWLLAPARNLARYAGHYLGRHGTRHPAIRRAVSLDLAKRRGGH